MALAVSVFALVLLILSSAGAALVCKVCDTKFSGMCTVGTELLISLYSTVLYCTVPNFYQTEFIILMLCPADLQPHRIKRL